MPNLQPEDGPVAAGVQHQPLADPPGGEEVPSDEGVGEGVGGQAALEPPGVGRHHLGDLPVEGRASASWR